MRTRGVWVGGLVVACCLVGLAMASVPVAAEGPAGMNGSGTAEDPYEITNATQLQAMEEEPGANYTLVENVDAGGVAFEPIGNDSTQFTGSFNGLGHVIDGLDVDADGEAGLFGAASAASIENVSLEDADVVETSGTGVAGVLIGAAVDTNVSNVYVDGTVNGQVEAAVDDSDVGGLIGTHNGQGTVSASLATVGLSGTNTGGLVGSGDGAVESSYWDEFESTTRDSAGGGENSTTANLTGANATDTLDGFDFATTWIATDDYPTLQGSVDDYTLDLQADELGGGETTDATIHLSRTTVVDLTATDPADFETDDNVSVTDGVVTAERDGTGTVTASASGYEDEATVEVDDPADFQLKGVTDSITVEPGENVTIEATIENVGGIEAEQEIGFEVGDETIETKTVTLDIDETTTQTFEWETADDDSGDYQANVSTKNASASTDVAVEAPATFEIDELDVPDEVDGGETLEANATIENVGDNSGETGVALSIDDEIDVDNATVDLDGGENETVTLEYKVDEDAATENIDVNVSTAHDSDEKTVDVQAVDIFEIVSTTDSITQDTGENVTVDATIENIGGADGEQELSFCVGDETIETRNVTVDSGENVTETFEWETDEDDRGDHTATIESEDDAGTTEVTIEQPATFNVTELDVPDDVNAGETLEVEATIENVGDRTGNGSASLLIDDDESPVASEWTGDLASGENETVALAYDVPEDAADGSVDVNLSTPDDSDEETVEVQAVDIFEIDALDVPGKVNAGETLSVDATIENVGNRDGQANVGLSIDDESDVDTASVDVDGGASETVTLEYEVPEDADTGTLEATVLTTNDSVTRTVSVDGNETLSGTITDGATGEALSDVSVTVDDGEGTQTVETDGSGAYQIPVLNDREVTISATKAIQGAENSLEITGTAAATVNGATAHDLVLHPTLVGSGTETDPYEISNARELQAMNQDLSGHYVLVDDVGASGTSAWNDGKGFEPVGDDTTAFTGSFDGGGYAINGLTIDRPDTTYVGLFGTVEGTITNVSLTDIVLAGDPDESYVGGVVGGNGGVITKSSVSSGVIEAMHGGGIAGTVWNDASVSDSHANVTVDAKQNAGGLAGTNYGTISTSYATGVVTLGDTDDRIGGIVGNNQESVSDSYWNEDSEGDATSGVGKNGDTVANVADLTTAEMTGANATASMTGFDFDDTWTLTDGYPRLQTAVEELDLSIDDASLQPGDSATATVALDLVGGETASATTVANYTVSDTSVLAVDGGSITAIDDGTAAISATLAGVNDSVTVSVEAPPSDGSDDDADGPTTIERVDGGTATELGIAVENAQAGDVIVLDGEAAGTGNGGIVAAGNTSIDAIEIEMAQDRDFTLTAGGDTSPPGEFGSSTGSTPLGTLQVEHDLWPADVESVTFSYTVPRAALGGESAAQGGIGATPEDVALHRLADGEWSRLSTTVTGGNDTHVTFESSSPGFSTFAIGADAAVFEVAELSVDAETVVIGAPLTATATVGNVGLRNGTYDGDVVVDGAVVDTVTADLAANGVVAVNATHTFESAGTHELCLGGACTSVTVAEGTDGSTDSTDARDGADGAAGTEDSLPGFGALLTLFAIALLAASGRLRRE